MNEHIYLDERDSTAEAIRIRQQKIQLKKMRTDDLRKAIILVIFVTFFFCKVFGYSVMYGNSMNPALKNGDLLFYYRLQSGYENGDVVIYEVNHITYVGRIVALPQKSVEITEKGQLIVNGYTQADFHKQKLYRQGTKESSEPLELSRDEYFILADDNTSIEDSRTHGAISEKNIKGVVITIFRRRKI